MVQAGVNPFPAGPGFPAPPLNASDGTIPVAMTVKNDGISGTLKSDATVNISPAISQAFSNSIANQFSPSVLASHAPVSQQQQTTVSSSTLPLSLTSVSIANPLEKQSQQTHQPQQQQQVIHTIDTIDSIDMFIILT